MSTPLVTIHPFDPWGSKIGGIETVVRSMLQHAPDDFDLSLVGVTENPAARPPGQWQLLDFRGRPLHFYPLFAVEQPNRRTWIPLFLRFPLRLRLKRFRFDQAAVVYHRIEPPAFTNIPSKINALCVHGDPREMTGPRSEVRWRCAPRLYRRMESRAVRKSHRLFVVSREGVSYFQEHYPSKAHAVSFLPTYYRDDVFTLSDPSQTDPLRRRFIDRFQLAGDARFVLFAGRWEEQKNPLLALRTFAALSARHPGVHLLLAGGGSLQPQMEAMIQSLQISGRVHFLGPLPPHDLADAMRASDAFLMSSRFEGMPIAALEALACGLPTASTDAGEIRPILQEGINGRIASAPDPESLAQALSDVIASPHRYRREACARSVEAYRPASILPAFFDALRKTILL
ncbi:MAG: glycosyltransferase family 4 protein [Candidatus Omnitrophica bacterium]|nr:glycosyltransferase family 4 protein [Candidatus Omnitrophota bacterium]